MVCERGWSGNIGMRRECDRRTAMSGKQNTTGTDAALEISNGSPDPRAEPRTEPGTAMPSRPADTVLCVDLDGTLVRTDLAWECILSLIKAGSFAVFLIPVWLLRGIAVCKKNLARRATLNIATLPYRSGLLSFLRDEREKGRKIALVTAADSSLAEKIAEHLGIFDRVFATQDGRNLKGQAKADLLQREFAESGYEYIGDSTADLPVWKASSAAYVVGNERLVRQARKVARVERVFESQPPSMSTWLRALRGHHWAKNILLFLPLLLAHRWEFVPLLATAAGFVIFSLCASGIYIVNDLLDLHSDRAHPWKARRPFASGETSIPAGLLISTLLTTATIALGFALSVKFGVVLVIYIVATLWYSLHLKRVLLLDIFFLSGFYSIRLWAGAAITGVPLSDWFLVFSLFFFLSLATAKRYSELLHAGELVESGESGRAYIDSDRQILMQLGMGSSIAAVIILALYAHSREFLLLYRRSEPMLLACPVILYWLSRIWIKASRGTLDEDPLTLSMRDPVTYAVAATLLAILIFSDIVL